MWKLQLTTRAEKAIAGLDKQHQIRIGEFLDKVIYEQDPHKKAKALTGTHKGLWRYRVGDYIIICEINNKNITILVLDAGHRKEIY